jgi:hypothetical protein
VFKVEAVVNGDQLETLLLAAKAAGVNLSLGVVPDERPSRRSKSPRKERSTRKLKPKRYKANMTVKLGPEPETGPKLIKLHRALRTQYGDAPFRKGDAKSAVAHKVKGYSGSLMTKMLDAGYMIPA